MLLLVLVLIIGASGLSIIGFQFFNHTGIFHQPGKLILDDSLSEGERNLINQAWQEQELAHDLTIASHQSYQAEPASGQHLLYNIYVPVIDFYNPVNNISAAEISPDLLIPIAELNHQQKLLAIDDNYYLDNFNSGAIFHYLDFNGDPEDVVKITTLLKTQLSENFPSTETVLTLAQTGVTALSRRMTAKLAQVGDANYFTANIGAYLSQFDLTHTSNESSFSDQATSSNICSKPAMIDVLTAIGVDIVELTGNHNQDCGDEAASSTIDLYHQLGIQTVGGGKTAQLAEQPLEINQKNTRITMLAYNLSTGGYTLDDTPGANFYTLEKATADIEAAKARGDFIIVDIQYYECNAYDDPKENPTCDYANSSAGDQIDFFRQLIDLGADIVVGTSAHQPQTYELYHDGAIYYGLGNLFFDQSLWPGTTRSLILVHYFWENRLLQTKVVPTIYDDSFQTTLMDDATTEWFINRLNQARPTS